VDRSLHKSSRQNTPARPSLYSAATMKSPTPGIALKAIVRASASRKFGSRLRAIEARARRSSPCDPSGAPCVETLGRLRGLHPYLGVGLGANCVSRRRLTRQGSLRVADLTAPGGEAAGQGPEAQRPLTGGAGRRSRRRARRPGATVVSCLADLRRAARNERWRRITRIRSCDGKTALAAWLQPWRRRSHGELLLARLWALPCKTWPWGALGVASGATLGATWWSGPDAGKRALLRFTKR
jgi:hypothetical protein